MLGFRFCPIPLKKPVFEYCGSEDRRSRPCS
jgi:hypothetical protein